MGSDALLLGRARPALVSAESHNQARREASPTPDPGGGNGLPALPSSWAAKRSFYLALVRQDSFSVPVPVGLCRGPVSPGSAPGPVAPPRSLGAGHSPLRWR